MDRLKTEEEIQSVLDDTFFIVSSIKDPEFPQTLGDLNIPLSDDLKKPRSVLGILQIVWVPTVPHCHLASQIGLSIVTKLQRELLNFDEYKLEILIKKGTHEDEANLDKQINDKERVSAAQENSHLMEFIENLISYE